MSRSTNARTINQLIRPRVYLDRYIYDINEPRDVVSRDTPLELEEELLGNSYLMRRQLRHRAQMLRHGHS